jgi:hypothetical protein
MEPLCCRYRNTTDRMCVVRCCGPDAFFLERVVFPFETLHFRCPPGSDVEIWRPERSSNDPAEALAAEALRTAEAAPAAAPAWWPARPARPIGVRTNASAVCLERP